MAIRTDWQSVNDDTFLSFAFHETLYSCSEVCGTKVKVCIPAEVVTNYVLIFVLSTNSPIDERTVNDAWYTYASIACLTLSDVDVPTSSSTRNRAKSIAVPGPWLVIIVPSLTTLSSEYFAPMTSIPG